MRVERLSGVNFFEFSPHEDLRGTWLRCWDKELARNLNQESSVSQISVSINPHQFTLRGMHFLDQSAEETKTIFCFSGAVQDVVLDVRPESPTYLDHLSIDLSSGMGLIVDPGLAHGFLTLESNSNLLYVMSTEFIGELERGFLWSDPAFEIRWQQTPRLISEKDSNWSRFVE